MEPNVIIGLLVFLFLLFFGLPSVVAAPHSFIHESSLIIVFFGTNFAIIIGSTFKDFKTFLRVILFVFKPPKYGDANQILENMLEYARIVKTSGKMGLMPVLGTIKDPFMKFGLEMVSDKLSGEFIKTALFNDIDEMQIRHNKIIGMYKNASILAPVYGMIGTVVGLIMVLQNLSDPGKLGSAMAISLLTTLYGAAFAGMLYTPIAYKLKSLDEDEAFIKKLIAEGVLMIEHEEIPLKVEKYLQSFMAKNTKKAKKAQGKK